MIMMYFRSIISLICLVLVFSCSRSGILNDVPVSYLRPVESITAVPDTSSRNAFTEVGNCIDIQIVNDSIMICQDQATDSDPYFFKAFSTDSHRYLGSFIRKGRGPGEMISPRMASLPCNVSALYLTDNSEGTVSIIDVARSIESGMADTIGSGGLSPEMIDWCPVHDNGRFVLELQSDRMVYSVFEDEKILHSFAPYGELSGETYATHLSSILLNNFTGGIVAEVMLFLPQINLFDTSLGTVRSIASDKSYRNWKSMLDCMIGPDTVQYYMAATCSSKYIFAAYKGMTLKDMMSNGSGTSIHIFDWEGKFIRSIQVEEDIREMTFDESNNQLYGIDKSSGNIVRYNLQDYD